jgi:HPt (histidine-containing phosphotransfer) domain-containing protein
MQGDRERCLEAGMDDYVSKPIQPKDVQRILVEARSPDATASPSSSPAEVVVASPVALDASIDWDTLSDLLELGGADTDDQAERIVETFLANTPALLTSIRVGLEGGDARAVRGAAHSLKGPCGTLGIAAMATMASRLEAYADAGTLDPAAPLAGALCEEFFGRVRGALETYLSSRRASPRLKECG